MNCNPADFYPFNKYTLWVMIYEVSAPLIFILLGVFAYLNSTSRKKKGKTISIIHRIIYGVCLLLAAVGVRIFFERVPKSYGYFTLHKNYQERHTKIISIDFNPKGINLGKYVVKHKTQIDYKDIIQETSVYNKDIMQRLKNYKSGNGTYWIYYNPDKPDIYLVDFRDTVDKLKSVCEEAR